MTQPVERPTFESENIRPYPISMSKKGSWEVAKAHIAGCFEPCEGVRPMLIGFTQIRDVLRVWT